MNRVDWLVLDLNSYFASVEQQEQPALRNHPVAVVPVMTDSTCCIAASYEAKAFGIRTGTRVSEAKTLCPELHLVEANPPLYVLYHHKIIEAIDSCVPVASILSIDEVACELTGSQRDVSVAIELSLKIKRIIAERTGPCLRSSIGLAPNRFLAKVASDMKKPDGLTVIRLCDLPNILFSLKPRDLPGIGSQMEKRLEQKGIRTLEQLTSLNSSQMKSVWGSVVGERFYGWLRGENLDELPTQRRSIGHSHVLEPSLRTMTRAFPIVQKLTCKAALRLRKMDYWASHMTVSVKFLNGPSAEAKARLDEVQDTSTFLTTLKNLWERLPARNPLRVGVTFHSLVPAERHTPSFLGEAKKEELSIVMDKLNDKYGKNTTYFASLHRVLNEAPVRIGFTRIPHVSEF